MSFWRRIPLFGRRNTPRAPASHAAAAERATVRRMTGRLDPAGFVLALDQLLAADSSLRSRLQILSLSDFREAAGAKWERLADKVALVTDSTIRQHLSPHDLFTEADPETFVIAMPRRKRDDARQVMVAIAETLSARLLGGSTIGGGRPMALASNIALDDARAGKKLDVAAIRQAVGFSRSLVSPSALGAVSRIGKADALEDSTAAAALLQMMQGSDRNGLPEWEYFTNARAVHAEDGTPPMPPDARLGLVWRPTWVSDRETIDSYAARVVRRDGGDEPPLEGARAYSERDLRGAVLLDRFVIGRAVRDLKAAAAAGQRTSVIVPVSWPTMTAPSRAETMLPLADLDATVRRRQMKVELFNIPDDATIDAISAVLDFLSRTGCEVMVRSRLSASGLPMGGVANVGLELGELRPDEKVGDEELLARLEDLQRRAGEAGARCYLWGARRRRVIASLVQGGFSMINGPGLMEDVHRPAIILPTPRQALIDAA